MAVLCSPFSATHYLACACIVPQVRQQQYQVDIGAEGTLRCAFATTHDLLFVLLKKEVGGSWGGGHCVRSLTVVGGG